MPRLLGVDLPNDKPTVISLQYLYGVGKHVALELCHKAGVDPHQHARELAEDELGRLAALLERDYTVEGPLRRLVAQSISRLKEIKCYRGMNSNSCQRPVRHVSVLRNSCETLNSNSNSFAGVAAIIFAARSRP